MIGSIASVASSLIGGLFGNHAQSKANKFNAEENEKNRQFNSQQAELSYQRQRTLIEEQRDYDSAVNQRKRLEEAGFNPYNMMDGSNVGTTQNMSAPPSASAPSPIPMQAQRYEWLQNMAMQAAQIKLIEAQAKNAGEDANLKAKQAGAAEQQGDLWFEQSEHQRIVNNVDNTYYEHLVKSGIDKNDSEKAYFDGKRLNESIASVLSQRQFSVMTPVIASNTIVDTIKKQMEAFNIDVNTRQGLITAQWLGKLYGAQYVLSHAQAYSASQQGRLFGEQSKTEALLRLPRLNGISLDNSNKFTLGGIYGEQLKQSKWNTYFLDETQREFVENFLIDMRSRFGSSKSWHDGSFKSWLYDIEYGITDIVRNIAIPGLTGFSQGLGQGFGFGYGNTMGQRLATPAPRSIGFKY